LTVDVPDNLRKFFDITINMATESITRFKNVNPDGSILELVD